MKYKYGILRTDISVQAGLDNSRLLGSHTLGIEVTVPELASRCGLGNIDPQHNGSDGKSSAIEDALTCPLPPSGSCLVTIRPDKDSFGAMAVLTLRAQGKQINTDLVFWIGLLDSVGFQNACETRPKPNLRAEVDAIDVIVHNSKDTWATPEEKVRDIARILSGEMAPEEINEIASLKKRSSEDFETEMCGSVVFIEAPGKYNQARDWGNQRYPVVVIFDPEYSVSGGKPYARWSVVRKPDTFDRHGFEQAINGAEAQARDTSVAELVHRGDGWGGPRNIVSSPQGRESLLSKETVLWLVREYTEFGTVS